MPRGVKKENLPSKVCEVCKRPFTWRKVWERCWDDVKTCSDRCKAERKKQQNKAKKDESNNSVNTKETGPEVNQMLKTDNGTALVRSFVKMPASNLQLPLHHRSTGYESIFMETRVGAQTYGFSWQPSAQSSVLTPTFEVNPE